MPTGSRYNPNQAPLPDEDPYSYASQVANGPAGGYVGASDDFHNNTQPYDALEAEARARYEQNNASLDPYQQAVDAQYWQNQGTRATNLANQGTAFQNANAGNAALFQGLQGAQNTASASSAAALGGMNSRFDQASAMDAGNVGQLNALNGTMRQLQASPYVGDVSSDAGLVGMQQGAYDSFGNIAGGGMDAFSDPGLVGQQQGVADAFGGWASGANDISSDAGLVGMQQGVYDDYGGFASGQYDLTSQAAGATADAEALAAQKEALGEFRERMDPRLTDAERFLYMQSRLAQEQGQRANRDANYRELERKGMGGSTMALSNLNASSAESSNTRALQDLGANAKAVDRAEKALVNYGNMGSTIADQSFERDFSTRSAADKMAINNNQQRLQGIAGQGQMSTEMRNADDAMRSGNANRQLQGLQGQGTMVNSMRQSDDAMKTNNMNRRVEGVKGQATVATDMRNADDAIRMNNQQQQGIQSRFQDTFAADQQAQAWGRGTDISNAGFRQTEGMDRRAEASGRIGVSAADAEFGRSAETTRTGAQMNRDYMEGYDSLTGRSNEAMRDSGNELSRSGEFALGRSDIQQRADDRELAIREKSMQQTSEDRRARQAENAARESQARQFGQDDESRSFLDYIIG